MISNFIGGCVSNICSIPPMYCYYIDSLFAILILFLLIKILKNQSKSDKKKSKVKSKKK
ncbi:hypothetical protein LCGC14_0374080 [marine sediment metagenome]|uniref:Uncharacterized protein n=1 Tax=marine sediment metagenome TaxID=412755 RepID=A0A0F9WCT9_9ZZZZ